MRRLALTNLATTFASLMVTAFVAGGQTTTFSNINVTQGGYYQYGGLNFAYANSSLANNFVGYLAGNNNGMTGSYDTGVGYASLRNNTSGNYGTAFGGVALTSNTTGSYNTGIGYAALYWNTTGRVNTAIGAQALQRNTGGVSSKCTDPAMTISGCVS